MCESREFVVVVTAKGARFCVWIPSRCSFSNVSRGPLVVKRVCVFVKVEINKIFFIS